jgi:NTE family protein
VSEPYFSNIYPNVLFNAESDKFTFQLTRRPRKNFSVDFGGVIATRNVSNIALGINYFYFNRALAHFQFEAQTGSFYKSVNSKARIDLPFYNSIFIEPEIIYNNWDYLESEDLLQKTSQTVLRRFDRKAGLNIFWTLGSLFKMSMGVHGFRNNYRYVNTKKFVSSDTLDE